MGFLLLVHGILLGACILPMFMVKGAYTTQTSKQKYVLLKKHPKKLSGKSAALFPVAIFVVSSKVRIKMYTSFEELLMSVLSRCQ